MDYNTTTQSMTYETMLTLRIQNMGETRAAMKRKRLPLEMNFCWEQSIRNINRVCEGVWETIQDLSKTYNAPTLSALTQNEQCGEEVRELLRQHEDVTIYTFPASVLDRSENGLYDPLTGDELNLLMWLIE